jgi:integrase
MYAGVDILTGRELYLKRTIPAGPHARQEAERVLDGFRQIAEGRQPKTNAPLVTLLERHLERSETERRNEETLRGYLRKIRVLDLRGAG